MNIWAYVLSAIAIVTGAALDIWGSEGSSLPMILIMAGVTALGANHVRNVNQRAADAQETANRALEETQTIKRDQRG